MIDMTNQAHLIRNLTIAGNLQHGKVAKSFYFLL